MSSNRASARDAGATIQRGRARLPGYLGPDQAGGRFAELRARDSGLSSFRSRALGQIGSFRDGWVFRGTLAAELGCSVRTVQRAITQGKGEGLIGVARAKQNETPPGAKGPIPCGWSHRWTIGRDLAGEEMRAAVARAKLAMLMRVQKRAALSTRGVPHAPQASRGLTPEQRARLLELEAEERAELEAMAAAAIAATEARSRAGPGNHN